MQLWEKQIYPSPYLSVLFINWSIKKLYFRSFATGDENAAAYLKMIFILSCCCWKRKKLHDVCLKLPWSSSSSSKNLLLWSFIYNNCCQIQDSFILLLEALFNYSWSSIKIISFQRQPQKLKQRVKCINFEQFIHQFLGALKITQPFTFLTKIILHGVWKSQKKSYQHCERSELLLILSGQNKVIRNAKNRGQTVLPDRSILIGRKLVTNGKIHIRHFQ